MHRGIVRVGRSGARSLRIRATREPPLDGKPSHSLVQLMCMWSVILVVIYYDRTPEMTILTPIRALADKVSETVYYLGAALARYGAGSHPHETTSGALLETLARLCLGPQRADKFTKLEETLHDRCDLGNIELNFLF